MKKALLPILSAILIISSCKKDSNLFSKKIKICDYDKSYMDYSYKNNPTQINELDINNDNKIDIKLASYNYSSPNGYSGGSYLEVLDDSFMYSLNKDSKNIMCGDILNENINWLQNDTTFQSHSQFYSNQSSEHIENWVINDGESAFIAIRYSDQDEIKYGWIKVEDSEVKVVEYAIEN